MILNERINCRIYCYNYDTDTYAEVYGRALNESDIIAASVKRQCCSDGGFEIGGVYTSTLSMQVHLPGMSLFQVRGAKITVWSKYSTEDSWYRMGTFWVTDAERSGEIFTLNAQDAVGWLDTSSYNSTSSTVASVGSIMTQSFGAISVGIDNITINSIVTEGWLSRLTRAANFFIQMQTGIKNMLTWESVSDTYCNKFYYGLWNDGKWHETDNLIGFSINSDSSGSYSDSPRDYYKYLSELTFGFIYAKPSNGSLTLGRFGAPDLGTVAVGMDEIEVDTCDVADYTLKMLRTDIRQEGSQDGSSWWGSRYVTNPDYSSAVWIRFLVDSNPFVDSLDFDSITQNLQGQGVNGPASLAAAMYQQFYRDEDPYTVRPFSCTVHSTKRFELGQKIKITYRNLHETKAATYDSIITSIMWTFRGGCQLACGGEDSRVMADCMRSSKGDKVQSEARNRCRILEKRVKDLGG